MIEVRDKKECCGCTACASACSVGCIDMTPDEEGFLYPSVDAASCVGCDRCVKVCPTLNRVPEKEFAQTGFVVRAKDADVLSNSTSGGAFTLIAAHVLNEGGFVFGVGFDGDSLPCHKCAHSSQELAEFRGSKYVQSNLADTFPHVKETLRGDAPVLFSGTPCQVEGLLNYLGSHPDNLLCLDVVCRAVPSPLVWRRYLEYVGRTGFARFRDKKPYGYQYGQMSFADAAGRRFLAEGVESNPFLRAFFSHLSIRPACFACAFKKRYRRSDFTLWDCWDANTYSDKLDADLGATKVLCHTSKAVSIAREAFAGAAIASEADPDALVAGEKEIVESPREPENREAFFRDCVEIKDPAAFFDKWFPTTGKVVLERTVRRSLARLGLLGKFKNFVKGVAR